MNSLEFDDSILNLLEVLGLIIRDTPPEFMLNLSQYITTSFRS